VRRSPMSPRSATRRGGADAPPPEVLAEWRRELDDWADAYAKALRAFLERQKAAGAPRQEADDDAEAHGDDRPAGSPYRTRFRSNRRTNG
jgi:hypothetical protein